MSNSIENNHFGSDLYRIQDYRKFKIKITIYETKSNQFKITLEIARDKNDSITFKEYICENTFYTKEEAFIFGENYGKDIIDKKIVGITPPK